MATPLNTSSYQNIDTPPEGVLYDGLLTDKQCAIVREKFGGRFKHNYLKPVNQSLW